MSLIAALFILLADTLSVPPTVTQPGTAAPAVVNVQGNASGVPIPVTGSLSVSGAGNTVGSTATFNANSVCATVWLAGQPGAAFQLNPGTSTAVYTPSFSADAAQSGNNCTGGTWTPTSFIDATTGNTSANLTTSNPNAESLLNVRVGTAVCARVCTGSSGTTGSATGFLLATVASATLAPSADVTDRTGRLLGKITGSDGNLLATANTGRLQVDVVTGGGGGGGSVTQGTTPWAVSLMNSGTTGVVMLNAVSATGASATYTNVNGYTAHVLHVVATGTPNIVIRLEGSYDNSNWNILSTVTQASASLNDLVASGWYPYLRANLNTFSGGSSPTLTAVYHGIDASIASTQLPAALDANGNLKVHEQQTNPQLPANLSPGVNLRTTLQDWGGGGGSTGGTFTSGSALDSNETVTSASISYATALISISVSGSITSGSFNIECSNDAGTTYFACVGARVSSGATDTVIALNTITKELWRVPFSGLSGFRVRLNPVITGAGTATVSVALSAVPYDAVVSVASLPLPAGASTETTLALIKAKTDNLDVALSTRTKPADTQAISAASLPLPTGAAADATLTGGTAKSIVRGGAKGATTPADVTSTANGADHNALDVELWLAGSALDPRSIRALTSSDTVTVVQGTGTNLHIVCDSGCSSSAGFADSAAFTVGTTAINPVGGLFDDTPPTAITTGKAAAARITNNRALHINLRNQAGTEIGTSSTPVRTDPTGVTTQPVSGTVGATQSGTWTVQPGNTANTTAWKVDGSAVTQPVSGTVGATQSGTWTVQPGNTANTTAWKVDGSAVTQPISASSLPLPTGAATETTLAKIPVAQGSTTSGQSGELVQGAVTTSAPTYTTAQTAPLSLDTTGSLRVNVTAGGGSNASVVTDGAAPASSDTQIGGSVTTAAPTYTTGQVKPFSLDTTGSLRVNVTAGGGSNASVVTDGAAPPASDTMIAGSVTTAAPTYTTGQSKPLSLQTDGYLRTAAEQVNTGTAGSTLLSAVTVAGAGSALTNGTGNTSHAVIITYTSTPTTVALNLEGSYNNSNWIVLASTNPTPATPSYLTACGWYPFLRANLVTLTGGTSPAVTAVYHGTNVASAVCDSPSNTYSSNTVNATCADPGTGCAAGTFISIPTAGQMSFGFHNPTSSTLAGTLKAECSYDNGSTYNQNTAYFDAPGATVASTTVLTSGVQYDATIMGCGGADRIRVRNVSATGSGALTMNGTMIQDPSVLFSGTSGSAVQPPRMISNAFWDGTNLNPPALGHGVVNADTQRVFLAQKSTHHAALTRTATAAGTGPFFNICGSATKTIRLQYLQFDIQVATAAINSEVVLTKTSAATTAGTATTLTDVPVDSSSAASTAVTKFYTVLATAGTPVGKIDSASGLFPITVSPRTTATVPVIFDYRNRQESESTVLRGTAQCVEAAFAATTTNAPTIGTVVKWTEE